MKIVFSKRSITDLKNIADYLLKEAGVEIALTITDKIHQVIAETISDNPKIGAVVTYIPETQMRFFSAGKYAYHIFYELRKTEIIIVRILHNKRDIRKILEAENL
ncbi:MAG: type II toxin-antitoxin system RelE/ParE family toxin [Cocleimonas sp.]|nr:type II toxin-antitoxin system RelE/ParE family toxin [Cocleimonas sp.]